MTLCQGSGPAAVGEGMSSGSRCRMTVPCAQANQLSISAGLISFGTALLLHNSAAPSSGDHSVPGRA